MILFAIVTKHRGRGATTTLGSSLRIASASASASAAIASIGVLGLGLAFGIAGVAACSSTTVDDSAAGCVDCAETPRSPTSGTLGDGGVTSPADGAPTATANDLTVTVDKGSVILQEGASIDVLVTVARPTDVTEALTISVLGLPPAVIATAGTIPRGATQASVRISAAKGVLQGTTAFDLVVQSTARTASAHVGLTIIGAPGVLDTTFGPASGGGRSLGKLTDMTVSNLGVQADGHLVLGGTSGAASHDFVAVRFDANGLPDAAFGTGGKAVHDFGGDEYAQDMIVMRDGKILLGGYTYSPFGYGMAFARFEVGGAPDLPFGGGNTGRVVLAPTQYQIAYGLKEQPDGKILGAGIHFNGVDHDFAVARLSAQGALDTTFGASGFAVIQMGSHDYCLGATVDAQGRIVATGERYNGAGYDLVTARFSGAGALDTTFASPTGWVASVAGGAGYAYAWTTLVAPDGKVLVAGSVPGPGGQELAVLRYKDDGTLDATFGAGGKVVLDGMPWDRIYRMLLDSQGRLVFVGHSSATATVDASARAVVGRLLPNGALDTTFGSGGRVNFKPTAAGEVGIGVALDASGRIVVGGYQVDAGKLVPWVARFWN